MVGLCLGLICLWFVRWFVGCFNLVVSFVGILFGVCYLLVALDCLLPVCIGLCGFNLVLIWLALACLCFVFG